MKAVRRCTFAIAILAFSAVDTSSAPKPAAPEPARWDQILDWLPEDTETLMVAPRPFVIPKEIELFKFSEMLPAWPFYTERFFLKELGGCKCLCAVEGSRRFALPKLFGWMRYEGTHILQFDPASDDAVRKWFQAYRKKADKEIEVLSHPVAVFTPKQVNEFSFEVHDSYFVQPLPGVIICATHKGYLEEMLKRMAGHPKRCAFSKDSLELKQVDPKALVWGVRHYRKETAENDPTSPLSGKGEKEGIDDAAEGFVFWHNPESGKSVQVRYLSRAKDALQIINENWAEPSLTPKDKQNTPGVVHITVELSKATEANIMVWIWRRLGHGIATPAGW